MTQLVLDSSCAGAKSSISKKGAQNANITTFAYFDLLGQLSRSNDMPSKIKASEKFVIHKESLFISAGDEVQDCSPTLLRLSTTFTK